VLLHASFILSSSIWSTNSIFGGLQIMKLHIIEFSSASCSQKSSSCCSLNVRDHVQHPYKTARKIIIIIIIFVVMVILIVVSIYSVKNEIPI
jgi:hypothetical protein